MGKAVLEKRDGLGVITLNDPERMNGLSEALVTDFLDTLHAADNDREVQVIVITGRGKAFCAGGDISIFDRDIAGGYAYLRHVLPAFGEVEKTQKPVIAAVNGAALGGGCELTMACDMAIVSDSAILGLPEVGIGIMPGFAVLRLHQIVGRTRAKELILTGKTIKAVEAERIGLVNKVVPAEQLMDTVEEEAKILMSRAPLSLTLAKSIVNRELGGEEMTSALNTTTVFFGTEDLREGRNSFFDKRKPNFKGK
ncbi:MAG: enoyl-CoA hydratase-related protein [Desulfatiglans sp.]|jgi:enoyl-CoA hydratase/carnithine racemase|nr:enoyl-CoA hydratase-related protein [Thermodesulfobacteriota bacterium]MEE4352848.1 enoyl-CoA hydratase-related protein [Desulfatiglans sp.]